jgi:hypothetical protein
MAEFSTTRRGALGAMALAPMVIAASPIEAALPSLWQKRMTAYLAAKKQADLYYTVRYLPAFERANRDHCKTSAVEADECDRLSDLAGEAEALVQLTPAPNLSAVLWKLDQLFDREHRSEDDFIDSWHHKFTDSIRADVARLSAGGLN